MPRLLAALAALALLGAPLAALAQSGPIFVDSFEDGGPPAGGGASSGDITLTANASDPGSQEQINLGIPFPPGALTDAGRVRILDASGVEVPAFVKPVLRWHWIDDSIRAVKVQFRGNPNASYRFDTSATRTRSIAELPYDGGTRAGKENGRVPRVIATLDPDWLVASRIAGPQLADGHTPDYDAYVLGQWAWAKDTSYTEGASFLFDRASVIGLQYVRNGRADFFAEFYNSATFYVSHIKRSGTSAGGWEFGSHNACDPKYSYAMPQLLLLALAGDDTRLSNADVRTMAQYQVDGSWNGDFGPYAGGFQFWTERWYGLGLTHLVSAYEITGDAGIRQDMLDLVGWLYDHQQNPPGGDAFTGAWSHSWQAHEGLNQNAATDVRGGSPWMSANIIGGLWRAWLVSEDSRIPEMLRDFGRYMETHGWIDDEGFDLGGTTWMSGCNAGGTIAWYFSSGLASLADVVEIQQDSGWYSDSHNPELLMAVAAARYFETDPGWRSIHADRAELVSRYFNASCASRSSTRRAFNWQHRNPEAVWLLAQ